MAAGQPRRLRVYRVHDHALEQVSVDHSVVQELMDAGEIDAEAAAVHPRTARDHPGPGRAGAPRPRLLRGAPRLGLAGGALLRRGDRDDRRRRDRGDPRRQRGSRATPPTGSWPRRCTLEGRTTPPPWWSMWWDWRSRVSRTTRGPSRSASRTSWEPCLTEDLEHRSLVSLGRLVRHLRPARQRAAAAEREGPRGRALGVRRRWLDFGEVLDALIASGLRGCPASC